MGGRRWRAGALALVFAAQALGCGASHRSAASPATPASPTPASSAASASLATPSPRSEGAGGPAADPGRGGARAGFAPASSDRTQVFLSSIALHVNGGAALVAQAALAEGQIGAEDALVFDLEVALPDGATFPLLRKRVPNARARSSHLLAPFRVPTPKPAPVAARGALAPSFVIDYDSARFDPFAIAFDAKLGATKDVLAIEKFVSEYISNKTFSRQFDIASQVANSHTGDCTEHAVLLAAALRRRGIPSRVTLGVVFIFGVESAAFGHAWVEAEQRGETVRLDAALRGLAGPERLLHYYPLAQLADEGPGFSRQLLRNPSLIHVRSITLGLAR